MSMKRKTMYGNPKSIAGNIGVHLVLLILVLIWLAPLAWLVMTSFRWEPEGLKAWSSSFLPDKGWTLENYTELFTPEKRQIMDFPRMFLNTLFISICSTIIGTTFVLAVSYSMSRRRFKMRQPLMNINMILGLFPGFMSMVAVYFILKEIGLLEGDWTYLALILVFSAGSGSGFLLLKGYMDTIPRSLDESARIDGATQWQNFTKILIPIAKPMIVYQVLTSFLGPWVDFIFAKVIAGANSKYYTVSVGLYSMLDRERTAKWYLNYFAGAVMVSIPIALLTIIMQRFYSQSMSGAVKG